MPNVSYHQKEKTPNPTQPNPKKANASWGCMGITFAGKSNTSAELLNTSYEYEYPSLDPSNLFDAR
jgi:hypothetical protein